jgi:hypothetical protein
LSGSSSSTREKVEDESRAVTLADLENAGEEYRRIDSEIVERSLAEIETGRPRDHHLHIRNDRRAERRDALAREFRFEHQGGLRRAADPCLRPQSRRAAALAHIRAHGFLRPLRERRVGHYCSAFEQIGRYLQE